MPEPLLRAPMLSSTCSPVMSHEAGQPHEDHGTELVCMGWLASRCCFEMPRRPAAASGSLEEQWRQECLAFARVRKLKHVADMRIFYVVRQSRFSLCQSSQRSC